MTGTGPAIGTGTEIGTVLELVLVLGLILVLEHLLVPWRQVLGDRARLQQELQLGRSIQHPVSGLCTDSSWVWLVLLGRGRAFYDKGFNNESYCWYWLFKVALRIDHDRFIELLLCLSKMPRFSNTISCKGPFSLFVKHLKSGIKSALVTKPVKERKVFP